MRVSASFLLTLALPLASGFLFPQPMTIKDGLVKVTDAQKTTPLSIQLDIGSNDKDPSRMNVFGIIMELSPDLANYPHPKMPGADGPHPQLSSGIRTLNLIQQGSFVSMNGRQTVETLHGCWEIIWRDNAAAGTLVCGFDLPEEYQRNDARLPKGRMYMSFPLWTKDGLKETQEEKDQVLAQTLKWTEEKEENLQKYQQESNILMKALHYRNAAAALEKINFHKNPKSFDMVPTDDEIIPLQDDLLLTTKGLVFTKKEFFGDQVLLGTAFAKPVIE